MNAKPFKAFGFLVISLDLLAFSTRLHEILWTVSSSASQQIKMLVAFFAVFIVGVGLIGLRKWAAIYFSVPLLCIGLWVFCDSIDHVPFPSNLVYMSVGVSLVLPVIVTVRLWRYFSWSGKWFF